MAKKAKNENKDLQEVEQLLSRSEQFIEKNSKKMIYVVIAACVVAGSILGFKQGYLVPQEKKANAVLFQGEQFLAKDSFALALNGNGVDYPGFLAIANEYSTTKASNLAKAYAGICYASMGENEKAIEMFKDFNSCDDIISPAVIGRIGDCYVNMGETAKGIEYFEDAASANNKIISPIFLKKAGIAYESLKQYQKAIEMYQTIKDDYYTSVEAADIDKYITRATAQTK